MILWPALPKKGLLDPGKQIPKMKAGIPDYPNDKDGAKLSPAPTTASDTGSGKVATAGATREHLSSRKVEIAVEPLGSAFVEVGATSRTTKVIQKKNAGVRLYEEVCHESSLQAHACARLPRIAAPLTSLAASALVAGGPRRNGQCGALPVDGAAP